MQKNFKKFKHNTSKYFHIFNNTPPANYAVDITGASLHDISVCIS